MKLSPYLTGEKTLKDTTLEYIPMWKILPPHGVPIDECDALYQSMQVDGWIGRPVLGYWLGGKMQLVTGSHRVKVARRLRFPAIPVFVMSDAIVRLFEVFGLEKRKRYCDFFYTRPRNKIKEAARHPIFKFVDLDRDASQAVWEGQRKVY